MTLSEIKQALLDGHRVYWCSEAYEVIQDKLGQYLIVNKWNGYAIGLTWANGVTLNGKQESFYCIKQPQIEA